MSLKCPSCGSSEVGFASTGMGVIALIVIAAVVFGANKKETPAEAPSTLPAVTEMPAPVEHQAMPFEAAPEQAPAPTNIADVPDHTVQVEEKVQVSPATNACAAENEGSGEASDSAKCESKRAPKNELY